MHLTHVRLSGLTDVDLMIDGASPADPFTFQGMDGLGPVQVNVNIAKVLGQGGVYQGSDPGLKQLVIKIGLNPDWAAGMTASDLREILYGMLTPGPAGYVTVRLMNGTTEVANIVGWVSGMEADPFTKDPMVQLTIDTADSYFKAPALTLVDVSGLSSATPVITNIGNAPSGIFMRLNFTAPASGFRLADNPETHHMLITYPFASGDQLRINSFNGSRSVQVVRVSDGIIVNLLARLSTDSVWPQLHGGANPFQCTPSGFVWSQIAYTPAFWGV